MKKTHFIKEIYKGELISRRDLFQTTLAVEKRGLRAQKFPQ